MNETLCKCGHPKDHHHIPLLAMEGSRYDGRILCGHVPMLGAFSKEAHADDCGCQGWEPDPEARPHQCPRCSPPYGTKES